jgi:hypothetical protein
MVTHSFREFCRVIQEEYPMLITYSMGGEIYLSGFLLVYDKWGEKVDDYKIEIRSRIGFPFLFPRVVEIGNSYEHSMDWHTNADYTCCFTTSIRERIYCTHGLDPIKFMKEIVIPYFTNQTYRKINGYYLHGEYSHGFLGVLQAYEDILKLKGFDNVNRMVNGILNTKYSRTAKCPICNGKSIRNCHRDLIQTMQKEREIVLRDMAYIRGMLSLS